MRTSALFGAKTSDFLKILMCPYGKVVLSQCGHLDVFYGRLDRINIDKVYDNLIIHDYK